MTSFHFRTWESVSSGAITNLFRVVTKLQNFDNFSSNKSILGFIINLTQTNSNDYFNLRISYRLSEDGDWRPIDASSFGTQTRNLERLRQIKHIFSRPITPVENFQLNISGRLEGKIGINDITVLYRNHRDVSEDDF
tara:strand:+ start:469 stop:879 length:411 start_codon:yes stop_codon:yes gene_type:complete